MGGGVVLLTGATGFLGAQVARCLVERTDHQRGGAGAGTGRAGGQPPAGPCLVGLARAGRRDRQRANPGRRRRRGRPGWAWTRLTGRAPAGQPYRARRRRPAAAPLAELNRTNVAGVAHLLELASAAPTTTASPGSPMCRPRTWPGCGPTRCPRTT